MSARIAYDAPEYPRLRRLMEYRASEAYRPYEGRIPYHAFLDARFNGRTRALESPSCTHPGEVWVSASRSLYVLLPEVKLDDYKLWSYKHNGFQRSVVYCSVTVGTPYTGKGDLSWISRVKWRLSRVGLGTLAVPLPAPWPPQGPMLPSPMLASWIWPPRRLTCCAPPGGAAWPSSSTNGTRLPSMEPSTASCGSWGVDILVNNAAWNIGIPFTDLDALTPEIWDCVLATNLRGPYLLARACAPHLRAHRAGRIVNIASVGGLYPASSSIAYSASKAGLIHLTRCLAVALAPSVTVNCIAPGLDLLYLAT